MAVQQLVKFSVADQNFGISINQIYQIIKPQEVFKVPNTPPFIEGLINLRGRVLTVFNLRKRFNLPEKANDENTKVLIVNMDDMLLGFTVDNVTEIVRINDEDIEETPPTLKDFDHRFLSGVGKLGDKLILLLDLRKVLTPDEALQVQEIVEQHAAHVLGE
ncbi:MAG TPA: chemotaxis protein CheW [Thermoclostridium caenicola]|uniref:Purine-binding chemotaxis protein CheW n=1 Tax=Thermoclostridium caenicola TaxID=659425 RepID=A0A1M6DFN8_9FIRM|nr:chemotaxis protein CheW [Thermoclostridium caenicola]SHI72000.1 purine-binding chemotaxis protein CheW [Thermoclostridium caenicola]HOK42927.1 chemotaxis protein CheW [Thermoclostridium caenicola]HOL84332.1 chemotaxis protein CheW [Thermoclostridium caenicola]HOP72957.1 chemotaxis protein CheW [Thermoclostridium caenicola]HPO76217.1 chemotaxis protein CheW [Thermoclostridium caenicola]